ncbi:MAG: indole-3-glycerol-phosphate synthase TrpC, partial [Caldilinea sp.]|nr:indole-3-glycerol-phosphate synthase TrpC [Caldilinea sp.]
RNGAAAISCLTDSRFFQGKLEYLTEIKEHLRGLGKEVPVLRKDFVYHEYQVYEARMAGADAILLIAGVMGDKDLRSLRELA